MIPSRKDGGVNMLKDIKDAKEISCYDALTGRYTGEEDGWQKSLNTLEWVGLVF